MTVHEKVGYQDFSGRISPAAGIAREINENYSTWFLNLIGRNNTLIEIYVVCPADCLRLYRMLDLRIVHFLHSSWSPHHILVALHMPAALPELPIRHHPNVNWTHLPRKRIVSMYKFELRCGSCPRHKYSVFLILALFSLFWVMFSY